MYILVLLRFVLLCKVFTFCCSIVCISKRVIAPGESVCGVARVTFASEHKQLCHHNAAQPSPWQQHISVPQQLEKTHSSQVTSIHSAPAVCAPLLTYCSLYYQYQEYYNSFPQWRLVLNSLSHSGGQRFRGAMLMSAREPGAGRGRLRQRVNMLSF